MGRTLSAVVASLPKERRQKVHARFEELRDEVNGLQALRKAAGKAQAKVAAELHISQPSVSKIEKQTDMYLSTLTNYVGALGGELKLLVSLPSLGAFEIISLGELMSATPKSSSIIKSPAVTVEEVPGKKRSLKSKPHRVSARA